MIERPLSCISTCMTNAATRAKTTTDAFAPAVLRALSSAILLLGLIGDRRAR